MLAYGYRAIAMWSIYIYYFILFSLRQTIKNKQHNKQQTLAQYNNIVARQYAIYEK